MFILTKDNSILKQARYAITYLWRALRASPALGKILSQVLMGIFSLALHPSVMYRKLLC